MYKRYIAIILCLVHDSLFRFVWYRKLPSGNTQLEPESNRAFHTIAYDTKDYRHNY